MVCLQPVGLCAALATRDLGIRSKTRMAGGGPKEHLTSQRELHRTWYQAPALKSAPSVPICRTLAGAPVFADSLDYQRNDRHDVLLVALAGNRDDDGLFSTDCRNIV